MTNMTLPNQVVKFQNFYDSSNRVTNQIVADGGSYSFSYTTDPTSGAINQSVETVPVGATFTGNIPALFSTAAGFPLVTSLSPTLWTLSATRTYTCVARTTKS